MMFDVGITVPAVFGGSVVEGIERASAAGADGVEFFDWESTDLDSLSTAADEHDVEIYGTLAAGAGRTIMDPDAPALADPNSHDRAVADVERSIVAAADLGCNTLVVTVGQNDDTLDDATQRTAVVDALRAVAPVAEARDVVVVVEPLNTRVDHPGYFLPTTDAGVAVVDAVDSPNVKLLFDIYHQQITDGDVIRRLTRQIEHIGHIHAADNPGRHEPGTGELDYERIFAAVADLDYEGCVSGEFMPAGDPDEAARTFVELADEARR
ncbi:MAG TPA: TIM barrel protein [Halococcus sp.]|nr:TIM barrel protein [Halococcus sp.]